MNVSFVEPLRLAWSRMTRMLFRPARGGFWFTLGFAAFLSEYLSWGIGQRFGGAHVDHVHRSTLTAVAVERIVDFLRNPVVTAVVIGIALCALTAYVLFLWISSRGRFIFLDNVAHERVGIVEPWRRFKRLGNSIFLWRLVVNALFLVVAGAILAPFLAVIAAMVQSSSFRLTDLLVLLPLPLMLAPLAILAGYVHLFRTSFVEPVMYRNDIGVMAAWGRFLTLFRRRPLPFLVYGMFVLALMAVALAMIFAFGLGTLTLGFFLLATPYVGSVLLLPIEVTARALGPEFLAQFGPEFAALGVPTVPVPPADPALTSAPMAG